MRLTRSPLALGALDATAYSIIVPVAPAISDATGAGPAEIGLLSMKPGPGPLQPSSK